MLDYVKEGKWIVVLKDSTKWVFDIDNKLFDTYDWYKKMGTLESEFISFPSMNLIKQIKKIEEE